MRSAANGEETQFHLVSSSGDKFGIVPVEKSPLLSTRCHGTCLPMVLRFSAHCVGIGAGSPAPTLKSGVAQNIVPPHLFYAFVSPIGGVGAFHPPPPPTESEGQIDK